MAEIFFAEKFLGGVTRWPLIRSFYRSCPHPEMTINCQGRDKIEDQFLSLSLPLHLSPSLFISDSLSLPFSWFTSLVLSLSLSLSSPLFLFTSFSHCLSFFFSLVLSSVLSLSIYLYLYLLFSLYISNFASSTFSLSHSLSLFHPQYLFDYLISTFLSLSHSFFLTFSSSFLSLTQCL